MTPDIVLNGPSDVTIENYIALRGHIVADERQSMPTMQKELHSGTSSCHNADTSRRADISRGDAEARRI